MTVHEISCTRAGCGATTATLVELLPAPQRRWLSTPQGGTWLPPVTEQGANYRCPKGHHFDERLVPTVD